MNPLVSGKHLSTTEPLFGSGSECIFQTVQLFRPAISPMKKVKFPKIAEGKHVVLRIQKTGIVETRNALKVRCQKQVIEGVTIPNGYEIWIPQGCVDMVRNPFSNIPTVGVDAWKINEVLRFLVMEELRKSDR